MEKDTKITYLNGEIDMINPMELFKVKGLLGEFGTNHPKFFPFLQAVAQAGAKEGTVVEMTVTTPEGRKMETNLRLSQSDLELIRLIRELAGDKGGDDKAAEQPADAATTETQE